MSSEQNRAAAEDMLAEMVSNKIAGLADLAVKDYEEFEAQLFHYIVRDYFGMDEKQLAYQYRVELGRPARGWSDE